MHDQNTIHEPEEWQKSAGGLLPKGDERHSFIHPAISPSPEAQLGNMSVADGAASKTLFPAAAPKHPQAFVEGGRNSLAMLNPCS